MYKDKKCQYNGCNEVFTPSTGNQKYCTFCSEKAKQEKNRIRWKKQARRLNNYIDYHKECKFCGKRFTTHYKKKIYCGSDECEAERVKVNSIKAEIKRNKKKRIQTQIRRKEKRITDLLKIRDYFSSFNYKILYDSDYVNSHNGTIKVECPYGHEWYTTFHNFKDNNNRCMTCCLKNNYVSKPEQTIRNYFKENYPELECIYNNRSIVAPKELDLYFPTKNVAIEFCGLYWHSDSSGRDRRYHYEKMMGCFKNNIRLITIFEDEFINNFDNVISRICQAIGNTETRVFARKCIIKEIPVKEANIFFKENHLQGRVNAIKAWGLFKDEKLVSACSVGNLLRKHVSKNKVIELKRFCSLRHTTIVGGANKLFNRVIKYAKDMNYDEIRSYCDMRYANIFNTVYDVLGFSLLTFSKYTPHYFKNGVRYRNYSLRKTPEERLLNKTEYQLRKEQGYDRIWDCGHRTYVYAIN
jgi:hypothetical protein